MWICADFAMTRYFDGLAGVKADLIVDKCKGSS